MPSALIPPGVRAVFLDAVGTLLFPEPSAPDIYVATAVKHGLEISPKVAMSRFVRAYQAEEGVDLHSGWVTSEAREVARWRRIVYATLNGVNDPEACFLYLFEHFAQPSAWRVNPSAGSLFANLAARGYRLGLGSNYDARLRSVLHGTPSLAPISDRVVVSAEVGFRKPGIGFFQAVSRVAESLPDEVLFVGDDFANDYEGARGCGLHSVLLAPSASRPSLNHVITDLSELLK